MNKALWEIVLTINACLNPLRERQTQDAAAKIDLQALRSQLRIRLEHLRAAITEQYSERDAYLVLFPLVAHCDEWVIKMLSDINPSVWLPLQQELYQLVDAGDLFYEGLDNALAKPETLALVYEMYYFCLHDGFCGRYGDNRTKRDEYLKKLRQHIVLPPIEETAKPSPAPKKWLNFRTLNRVYYGGVGLLLLGVYFFLNLLASTWQPIN